MALTINTSLAFNAGTPKTTGKLIVAHATDTINASAEAEATYFKNNYKKSKTFVHFFVDDTSVYQSGTPGYKAWGCGNANSKAPVQVELCQFTDKARSLKAYKNFVSFLVTMAKKYGAELTLDSANKTSGIKSHDWCRKNYGGTTHVDPYDWLESLGISKAQFAKDLGATNVTSIKTTGTAAEAAPASAKTSSNVDGFWGPATTLAGQKAHNMKWQDGIISGQPHNAVTNAMTGVKFGSGGSPFVKVLQKHVGVTQDGKMGPATLKAMQKKMGTGADGKLSHPSPFVKALQQKWFAGKTAF